MPLLFITKDKLLTGNVFDQTTEGHCTFNLGGLILGWHNGSAPDKRRRQDHSLHCHLHWLMDHGQRQRSKWQRKHIPANSILIFEITLVAVIISYQLLFEHQVLNTRTFV